ncbi:MAG TPA: hypothetical protein VM183_00320 [Burkholderiales bacterium]|nr:hypothetical protein [Burkholderiales bacterium]
MRLVTFSTAKGAIAHVGVRRGKEIVDLGPGRMKDLLASGLAGARDAKGPVLDERAVTYQPPIRCGATPS